MKCYNHPERNPVAICKACGKAICHECSQETESGIACQQNCVDSLIEKKKLQTKLATHLNNLRRQSLLGSLFSIGMGIIFIYFSTRGFGLVYDFVFLLGIGFMIYGTVAQFVNMLIFLKNRNTQRKK